MTTATTDDKTEKTETKTFYEGFLTIRFPAEMEFAEAAALVKEMLNEADERGLAISHTSLTQQQDFPF